MHEIDIEGVPDFGLLLDIIRRGEEVAILDRGIRVAKVVPLATPDCGMRILGRLAGRFKVPDDFDAPLPDDFLDLFEGDPDAVVRDQAALLKNGRT